LFSSAADARKRPAKCASAHKQADDKADVVLLGNYRISMALTGQDAAASSQSQVWH
jgi:hypothetical protein